jgi:hypothetical protein
MNGNWNWSSVIKMANITTTLITKVEQYDELLGSGKVSYDVRIVYHEQVLCDAHMPIAIKTDGDYIPDLTKFLSCTTTESKTNMNKWKIKYKILILEDFTYDYPIIKVTGFKDTTNLDGVPCKEAIEEYCGYEKRTDKHYVWKEIKDLSELKIKKDEIIIIDICGNKSARLGEYKTDIIPKLTLSTKLNITLDKYAWWNASWSYKKVYNLSNASAGYQMKILIGSDVGEGSCDVNCESHCNTDFSDLRFTNAAEDTELDYWIESYTTDGVAVVWIETNGDASLYMYYGNAGASTTSSGANTFQFFDDFPGVALDLTTKWGQTGSSTLAVSGGEFTITTTSSGVVNYVYAKQATYGKNYAIRTKMKAVSGSRSAGCGFDLYQGTDFFASDTGGATFEQFEWTAACGTYNFYSTSYQLIDYERLSDHHLYGKVDGTTRESPNSGEPTASLYLTIGEKYAKSDVCKQTFDWVLIRKRPDTLITVSSYGAEETNAGGALTKALASSLTISDAVARTSVWQRTVSDTLSLSDLISKKPGKEFTETLTISDDFDYLRILLLSETLSLSDTQVFDYGKGLLNTLSISDLVSKEYGKVFSDTLSISDLLISLKYFLRNLSDTLVISDDFKYLRGFDIFDTLSISDSKSFLYGKNLSNTLSLNDLIRRQVGFLRTVSDTLTISDSCITSLYTAWFKVLSDTLTLNDLFRSQTSFNKSISETLSISETFQKDFHKILGDTLSLYESILYFKTASFLLALHDTLSLTSAMTWLKNQNLTLSDTLLISDYILAISSKDMEFLDSTGTVLVYLRRPYWDNLDGSLNFNSLNFAFRSGNYTSYVEDINDESITMTGFESANDVLTRFNKIAKIADDGTEITISLLGTEWDATYVVSSFTYRPIGLDVFEYTITLKLVR